MYSTTDENANGLVHKYFMNTITGYYRCLCQVYQASKQYILEYDYGLE